MGDFVEIVIELCEVHLRSTKTKSKTKPWDEKITEITAAVCALFNSRNGGLITLRLNDKCWVIKEEEPKIIDDVVRRIEQSVLNFVAVTHMSETFKFIEDTNTQGLQLKVKPVGRFCTVQYHMYLPTDYQVSQITFGDSTAKVAALLEPQSKPTTANFTQHCKEFRYKERMPSGLREKQTVQFKHLKDDPTKNVSLADRMTNKSNKLVIHVSAFANHEGGHLYFGVDDTTYTVEGQIANEKERTKIRRKVSTVLSKMVWPVKTPEQFWKIDFVPVVQKCSESSGYDVMTNIFVIVLTVAKCQGGVFVEEPESYHLDRGKVARIPLPLWKELIKKNSNEQSMNGRCDDELGVHSNITNTGCSAITPVCRLKGICVQGWSSPKIEAQYMNITQLMENFRNNANWSGIDEMYKKVLSAKTTTADLKLAATFQCIAAAYRQNKHKEAYNFLQSYHSLVKLAKNPAIFEVQELYSWSAIKRSERNYQESYRYTYDALQKMQLIAPGWITAWFLCNAASLLTMFASEELDSVRKVELIRDAECYYRQALEHGQTITTYKQAAANLHHRVHIYLAMLYLATSLKFNMMNYNQTISPKALKSAKESLRAAEDFDAPPMSGFNEFYFLLAKSDLCLRCFQQDPDNNSEQMKKSLCHANNAYKVAKENDFAEVLHYAQSRIVLLKSNIQEDKTATELVAGVLRNIDLA